MYTGLALPWVDEISHIAAMARIIMSPRPRRWSRSEWAKPPLAPSSQCTERWLLHPRLPSYNRNVNLLGSQPAGPGRAASSHGSLGVVPGMVERTYVRVCMW